MYRKIRGLAGLICPGLGQILAGKILVGLLAFGSVVIPLIWLALLLNQMVIRQRLWTMSEAAPTILDLAFIHSFSEIKNVPPPYYVLFFLAVFIHFWTAKSAMENGATAASSTSHEQLELKFLPVNAGETPEPVPAQAPKHQLLTAPVLDQKAESSSETSDKQSTLADKPLTNCSNEE